MYPKTMTLKAGKNNPRLPICRGNNGAGPGVHLLPPVKCAIPFPGTTWRIGQEVKTPPFHGGNTGSIPVCVTIYAEVDGIGRHGGFKIRCRKACGFKSHLQHQYWGVAKR